MTRNIFPRRPRAANRRIFSVMSVLIIAAIIFAAALTLRHNETQIAVDGQEMMRYAEQYGVSVEYLQAVMDGYVVYIDSGKYQYAKLKAKVPRQNYQAARFASDADGRITYDDSAYPDVTYGVDVSTYQGDIDWQAVAGDGIDFAIIRVGYRGYDSGRLVLDERFGANIEGAREAGLKVGVYFFSQAISTEEAEAEARLVLDAIEGYDVSYPVVFDMEQITGASSRIDSLSVKEVTAISQAFCHKIAKAGYQPMLYGNTKWLASRIDLGKLKDYPLWFAQYYYRPLIPYDFAIWQYTSSGTVAGIPADVDLNICFKQPWDK